MVRGIGVALAIAISVSACGEDPAPDTERWWAGVDSVRVVAQGGDHVRVFVAGDLPNGCSELAPLEISFEAPDSFLVYMASHRRPDAFCTQAVVPYEHTLELKTPGPGTYGVRFYGELGTLLTHELVVE